MSSSVRPSRPRGAPVVRAVLEATLDELARVGYGALTFEDVAARAGVNKTTVYRRWPTKPGLVEAALTAAADAVPPLHETGDLRDDLIAVARRARDSMSSPRGRGLLRMLLGGCLEPDLVALAFSLRKQVEAPARRVIERAVLAGALRADTDPGLLLGTMSGWILHVLFREHGAVPDERLTRAVDLLIEGAAPRARSSASAR
jgi:AcrR family transcriptional regulator